MNNCIYMDEQYKKVRAKRIARQKARRKAVAKLALLLMATIALIVGMVSYFVSSRETPWSVELKLQDNLEVMKVTECEIVGGVLSIAGGPHVRSVPLRCLYTPREGFSDPKLGRLMDSREVNSSYGRLADGEAELTVSTVLKNVSDIGDGPFYGFAISELPEAEQKLLPKDCIKKDIDGIVWISSNYINTANIVEKT